MECVKLLLHKKDKKSGLDFTDATGWTTLMYASSRNCLEIAQLLLFAGANKDIKNPFSSKVAINYAKSREMIAIFQHQEFLLASKALEREDDEQKLVKNEMEGIEEENDDNDEDEDYDDDDLEQQQDDNQAEKL